MSLTKTANNIRKGILVFVVLVLVYTGFQFISSLFNSELNPFNIIPSFYIEADGLLGTIPEPKIPTQTIAEDSTPTFAVEGAFAAQPDTALVYSINRPRVTLDTVDRAVATATALGFFAKYQESGENELVWHNEAKTRDLSFDKLSKVWKMRTQYFFDKAAQQVKTLTPLEVFYETATPGILTQLGFTSSSLRAGTARATFGKLGTDGFFTKPLENSGADYVVLDMFRQLDISMVKPSSQLTSLQQNVSNKPTDKKGLVYSADPRKGSARLVVSNEAKNLTTDIFSLDFTDSDYNPTFGVYNLVTPQEGWDRVRQGKGALTILRLQTDDYFAPSRVLPVKSFVADASQLELAYYEPATWDGFIYPVYIFRGRAETTDGKIGSFVFFVDALERL